MKGEYINILNHDTRKMIYDYIYDNPGINYQFIKRILKINDGTFRYHLKILERNDLIIIKKIDNERIFFPCANTKAANELNIDKCSYKILIAIAKNPNIKKRDLIIRTSIDKKTFIHSIQLLKVKGFIKINGKGRGSYYYSPIKIDVD